MATPRFAGFETAVRADLIERRWLHVHAFLLGTVCFLCSWALSAGLMHAGVERLSIRWALALAATYLIYLLLLLRLWCGWLLSREQGDVSRRTRAL
jgi:cytosine/uracil/thiamine/allantoin permease